MKKYFVSYVEEYEVESPTGSAHIHGNEEIILDSAIKNQEDIIRVQKIILKLLRTLAKKHRWLLPINVTITSFRLFDQD